MLIADRDVPDDGDDRVHEVFLARRHNEASVSTNFFQRRSCSGNNGRSRRHRFHCGQSKTFVEGGDYHAECRRGHARMKFAGNLPDNVDAGMVGECRVAACVRRAAKHKM
jgi:hypothetical protein